MNLDKHLIFGRNKITGNNKNIQKSQLPNKYVNNKNKNSRKTCTGIIIRNK